VTLDDVVKTTVLLRNAGDFVGMREIYRRQFNRAFPARTGVISEFLDPECLIQIEAIAYKSR
jgi:2-iminobutanoate/2-iminopropanoate deaminase